MNVIQIGTGKMGQRWLDALLASSDATLVGVVEPVEVLRRAALVKTGLPEASAFTSVDDALVGLEFEAAVIVTPPPSHRPLAEQLLRAGKHVLLEKPLATSLDDARALLDVTEDTGQILMVAQNYRHSQEFQSFRNVVSSGELGAIAAVNIRFEKDARTMFGEGDFRYSMQHVLLVDMSIHHFDMLRAVLGTNVNRLFAQTWHVPDGNFLYDAAASVLMTMEGGSTVSYSGNWASYGPETSWNGEWEVIGEYGRLVWTEGLLTLNHWNGASQNIPISDAPVDAQGELIHEFVTAIENGTLPATHAGDNINSLSIVFAAVESSTTGQVVHLT